MTIKTPAPAARSLRFRIRHQLPLALLAFTALGLMNCERTAVFNPKFPDQAQFRVSHLGTYSSKLDEEKEMQGTIFETTLSFDLQRKAPGWVLTRHLDTLIAKGYHKFSMPHELEKKIGIQLEMDADMQPVRITGYDSLKSVLGRIQQKDEFRKQLLEASDTAKYVAEWRDWWRVNNAFLPKGIKIEARKPLPVESLNKLLETFKADSGRFDGPRPRMRKNCLEYTLWYHRTDSLTLLMEQFYYSSSQNRKYRKYEWHSSVVQGVLQHSVEVKTGLPCFHSRTESSDLDLQLKDEKAHMPIHLYRYEEDIYQY